MPTQPYRLKSGERVPGVTTVLGRFKESGGLIHWANRIALEPLMRARHLLQDAWDSGEDYSPLNQNVRDFLDLDPDLWDNKKFAQRAANAGTCSHDMFDCHVRKTPFDPSKYTPLMLEMALPACNAAKEWAGQSRFEIVETERPLVSERYRFGGTRDACLVNGKRAIGDWKTSNAIYGEYLAQLAAYAILDEEHGHTIDGGFHLLKFSKQEKPDDPVRFQHHYWSHLDGGRKAFLLMRELYDLMADLAKLAK